MTGERIVDGLRGRADAGYGIIGVIVALVLLSVGVLSVSSVLTQSVAMQTVSAQRTQALSIAEATMEEIRAMDPSDVAAVAEQTVDEAGDPDPDGVFTREVTVAAAGTNLIEVTVIVGAPRSSPIRLVTLIFDGVL